MTENETIKELHDIRPRGGIMSQKRAEALDMAIQALEKQIPKKPMRIERSAMGWEYMDYYCHCGKFIGAEPHIKSILEKGEIPVEYCDNCGQKLDWSDEE